MLKFLKGFIALSLFTSMVFFGCAKEELIDASNTLTIQQKNISIEKGEVKARALPKGTCQCFYQVLGTTSDDNDLWEVKVHEPGTPFNSGTSIHSGFNGNNGGMAGINWNSTGGSGISFPTNEEDFFPKPSADFDDIQIHRLDFLYFGEEEEDFEMEIQIKCYKTNTVNPELMTSFNRIFVRPDGIGGDGQDITEFWREHICMSCRPMTAEEAATCQLMPN